jgi:hypothetical protein
MKSPYVADRREGSRLIFHKIALKVDRLLSGTGVLNATTVCRYSESPGTLQRNVHSGTSSTEPAVTRLISDPQAKKDARLIGRSLGSFTFVGVLHRPCS